MNAIKPETHLLRELHVLASPVVLLVGLFTARIVEPRIGPQMVIQSFAILFGAGFLAFWIIGLLRSRKLRVRLSLWSAVVSATVNMAAVGSTILAFRIWYNKWPFNLEPVEPTGFTAASGEPFFIAFMLIALAGLTWMLGVLAVGATPSKKALPAEVEK